MSEQEHQEKLIKDYQRRLEKLEEQRAQFGLHTPPHILTEIEDCRAKLAELGLIQGQARLAEMPLDEVPPVAPLPPGSRMPLSPNPLFTGREQDLLNMARLLRVGETAAIGQIMAAMGLGGIGKTQLASAFVHRYGQYFEGGVFWLSFAVEAGIPAEIAACGGPDGLNLAPNFGELDLPTQVKLVQARWREPVPRLLVFDNCEEEGLLSAWRPTTGGGRVLVTSRRGHWDSGLGVAALALGVLSRPESVELLQKFRPDLAEAEAGAIAAELGDLPLALHLAGNFLKRYRHAVTPQAYLTQLRDKGLLDHPSLQGRGTERVPTGHERHVGRTFALSYDRLESANKTDALAQAILARAANFAPGEPIPRNLLLLTLELPEDDPGAPLLAEDALDRLVELGLLEAEEAGALVLHRLVARFVASVAVDWAKAQAAVEETVLAEANRLNNASDPRPLLTWQRHLRAITEEAQARMDERAADLCSALGFHLGMIGDYTGAQPYSEQALAIREQVFGPEHPNTATSLDNLGFLLHGMGDYEGTHPYYERALTIREKRLGPDHPATAQSLNNLGVLLQGKGDLEGARPYYERALAIRETVLGPDHPDTAQSLNNLGVLFQGKGDYEEAWPYYERALTINEKALGPDHPDTATNLYNLGGLLQVKGDYERARPFYERALAIRETVLGPEHPVTALSLDSLGDLLKATGDYAGAQSYYERALAINEKVLGAEHPDTAQSLNNLGALLQAMGDTEGARPYYERALAIFEARLGPDHPRTQTVRDNLESLNQEQPH